MNPEKLRRLQEKVRTGGKGSMRRKHKVAHKTAVTDDKKLQQTLKRLGLQVMFQQKNYASHAKFSSRFAVSRSSNTRTREKTKKNRLFLLATVSLRLGVLASACCG